MSGAQHTPEPWVAPGNGNVVGADGTLVAHVPRPKGANASARRDANAALVIQAVNNHADLLKALGDALLNVHSECCPAYPEDGEPPHYERCQAMRDLIVRAGGTLS